MGLEITHVHLDGGNGHEHITKYQWRDLGDGNTGQSDKPTMVDWIDNRNGRAYVGNGTDRVAVGVVRPQSGQPYLRTYADKQWTNNLLSLPRF